MDFSQFGAWRESRDEMFFILKSPTWSSTRFHLLTAPVVVVVVVLAGLRDSLVSSLVMLRGRERAFLAGFPTWLADFCWSTLSKSSMILSCWRRAYSALVKSPRRAGVAGGVGDGEVVPTGGVLEGESARFSEDASLNPRKEEIKIQTLTPSKRFKVVPNNRINPEQDRVSFLPVGC